MKRCTSTLSAVGFVALLLSPTVSSAPIPSKPAGPDVGTRDVHVATIEGVLARDEVTKALRTRGLILAEIESRLARLSDEDLLHFASNVEQIQTAGEEVPE